MTISRIVPICCVFSLLGGLALHGQSVPEADHHQHLFSPAITALTTGISPVSADVLVKLLDEAGIRRAAVFSLAYQFGNPNRPAVDDEYARVVAENDWTSTEVARFPQRLRGFCGVNPLREYALREVSRCAQDPNLRHGVKLHFGNSDVDLADAEHVEQIRRIFQVANSNRMAIVVHLRPSVTRGRPYGAAQARIFLDSVLVAAPDVPVQIAHLAGAGGFDDPSVEEALRVFIDAVGEADPRTARLFFDVSGVAGLGEWEAKADQIARRIRELGVHRVLYGSDGTLDLLRPRDAWAAFLKLPLTRSEFDTIMSNVAPYMR